MTTIGDISLDLVIVSKLNEQLDRIKQEAVKPAARLGDEISHMVSERFGRTNTNIQ